MVGRHAGDERKPFLHHGKHLRAQPDRVDKVDHLCVGRRFVSGTVVQLVKALLDTYVRLELLQTSDEPRAHKVELQAGVNDQRQTKRSNDGVTGILGLKVAKRDARWMSDVRRGEGGRMDG